LNAAAAFDPAGLSSNAAGTARRGIDDEKRRVKNLAKPPMGPG
jgi:hypothetical protein